MDRAVAVMHPRRRVGRCATGAAITGHAQNQRPPVTAPPPVQRRARHEHGGRRPTGCPSRPAAAGVALDLTIRRRVVGQQRRAFTASAILWALASALGPSPVIAGTTSAPFSGSMSLRPSVRNRRPVVVPSFSRLPRTVAGSRESCRPQGHPRARTTVPGCLVPRGRGQRCQPRSSLRSIASTAATSNAAASTSRDRG